MPRNADKLTREGVSAVGAAVSCFVFSVLLSFSWSFLHVVASASVGLLDAGGPSPSRRTPAARRT